MRRRVGAGLLVVALAGLVVAGGYGVDQWRASGDTGTLRHPSAAGPARQVCVPVTGDWDGRRGAVGTDTPGLVCKRDNGMVWSIANAFATGVPPTVGEYGNSDACLPVTGDWDGDGTTTAGVACGGGPDRRVRWSLVNAFSGNPSYPRFYLGTDDCWPLAGDWNGDGRTTVGAACADGERIRWELTDALDDVTPTIAPFVLGAADRCWPVTGDWDGDGRTTVGTACRDGAVLRWHLRDALGDGPETTFAHGAAAGCRPVTGDWDGDGRDSPGVACRRDGTLAWSLPGAGPDFTSGPATVLPPPSRGWSGPAWPR